MRKAWLPRPIAKNEYRQLSCSMRAGKLSPSARKALLAVPPSSAATPSAQAPDTRPTAAAVPVQFATARRQAGRSALLNLTSSGSVARPREALSTNE